MRIALYRLSIILLVTVPLIALIVAIILLWNQYVFLSDVLLLVALYTVAAIGITVGYHRMLTHRSFDAPEWLRALFIIFGTTAFEGTPIAWAARHVEHHAHSDEEDDPHSPLHGFWHAHFGWLYSIAEPQPDIEKYAPQLLQDRTVVFVDRCTLLWMGLSLLIPYLIGGWTGLLWGGGMRIFLVTHVTWSVNSICHTFGRRDFETTDESRNNWLIGLLAFGEGWHNNHHAFPESAIHGLRWWQLDGSAALIRGLEMIGLVRNVRRIPLETQKAHAERSTALQMARAEVLRELHATMERVQLELRSLRNSGVIALQQAAKDGLHRLENIKMHVAIATHLKRQKLRHYIAEVETLLQRCRSVPVTA